MKYPVVRFSLDESKQTTFTQSKVGGFPYLPIGQELPKNTKTGNTLTMLAQINFSEMPHLPDFPNQGILQFFIDKDDANYGKGGSDKFIGHEEYDNYTYEELYQNKFPQIANRVIYYADILPESNLVTDFSDYPTFNYNNAYSVIGGNYPIVFNSIIEKSDDEINKQLEANKVPLHQIGGYPNFLQGDEFYKIFDEPWDRKHILLFQLDSESHSIDGKYKRKVIFGDVGIANFFITPEDLRNLNFSKVAYTWAGG